MSHKQESFRIDLSATYGAAEAMLKVFGFNVISLVRDIRGNPCDGYIVSLSEKGKKIYLHFLEITQEMKVGQYVIEGSRNAIGEDKFKDYEIFDSISEARNYLEVFIDCLDTFVLLTDEDGNDVLRTSLEELKNHYPEIMNEVDEIVAKIGEERFNSIVFMSFPFYEFRRRNTERLYLLGKIEYTPNFLYLDEEDEENFMIDPDYQRVLWQRKSTKLKS